MNDYPGAEVRALNQNAKLATPAEPPKLSEIVATTRSPLMDIREMLGIIEGRLFSSIGVISDGVREPACVADGAEINLELANEIRDLTRSILQRL